MVSKNEKDLVTKMLGENLLKGYTLLDEYCLECTVSSQSFFFHYTHYNTYMYIYTYLFSLDSIDEKTK